MARVFASRSKNHGLLAALSTHCENKSHISTLAPTNLTSLGLRKSVNGMVNCPSRTIKKFGEPAFPA